MSQPHIVLSEDLEWAGLSDIQLDNLPDTIAIDGETLLKKDEFHITLMAGKFLAPLLQNVSIDDALQSLAAEFNNFAANHDLTKFTPTKELYLVKHEERVSIVILVDMPQLADFFHYLRRKFNNSDLPTQPAHITLYTLQADKGIWLTSNTELHQKGQKIALPDLGDLTMKSTAHV